jgi:hypothetical protein
MAAQDTDIKAPELLTSNTVKQWTKRIKAAKSHFEKDFKRMRQNMDFAAGIQREGQDTVGGGPEYVCNFVNREVQQKVASLYARDPKAIARRRKRMMYSLWDEQPESQWKAKQVQLQGQQQMMMTGMPSGELLMAEALLKDIEHGRALEHAIEKVGKTMEYLYQYECDTQQPDFKFQMKQLVRRTVITGVAYVKLTVCEDEDYALTSTGTDDSVSMRKKRIAHIEEGIDSGEILEDDPRHERLEELEASIKASKEEGDTYNIEQRLEFDFPTSCSIIVDPRCQCLKGFIGARWVAQQFILPLDDVNAYFESDIKATAELITYAEDGTEKIKNEPSDNNKDPQEKPLVCLWEVYDITTKSMFFICDGHKDWVQEAKPVVPAIQRFWPIFALTFNDVEVDGHTKAHIYPPSDVELMRSSQMEYNRMREELKKHRKNNKPFYLTVKGWLTDHDVEGISDHENSQVVEVEGAPPNGDVENAIKKFDSAPIDPAIYDVQSLLQDVGLAVGTNSQQQQQPQRHVAATPAMIQEQARISGVNSNVDDLDDLLSELARAAGEMMLRVFSLETVKRIAGPGALWPEENREDFLDSIFLDIVASSSGRPNKAVEIANFERIAPVMLQAGANPWGIIQEAIKRLDDRLEVTDFYPTNPPSATPAAKPKGGGPTQASPTAPTPNVAQQPVPMAAQQH